jgi:hypothetical protein
MRNAKQFHQLTAGRFRDGRRGRALAYVVEAIVEIAEVKRKPHQDDSAYGSAAMVTIPDYIHAKSPDDIALLGITAYAKLTGDHPKGPDIFLIMGKHRHVPVEIRYAAILFLKRQFAGNVGHAGRKHRQMKLGHGTVSSDEGKKKIELPSPSHHPRILSIRPRSARRHPAFLVGRIDSANNFAITTLQSHPSEIRRSDCART